MLQSDTAYLLAGLLGSHVLTAVRSTSDGRGIAVQLTEDVVVAHKNWPQTNKHRRSWREAA